MWASKVRLARTRERGAEERRELSFPLPLAASPLARAFSRDSLHSPKQESLLAVIFLLFVYSMSYVFLDFQLLMYLECLFILGGIKID